MDIESSEGLPIPNAIAGRRFEELAFQYFRRVEGLTLLPQFHVTISAGWMSKDVRFDFGSESPPILVACKRLAWTKSGKDPSAKFSTLNEAMYLFHLAPARYRKILFVWRHVNRSKDICLIDQYIIRYGYLIPDSVSIVEFDELTNQHRLICPSKPQ